MASMHFQAGRVGSSCPRSVAGKLAGKPYRIVVERHMTVAPGMQLDDVGANFRARFDGLKIRLYEQRHPDARTL